MANRDIDEAVKDRALDLKRRKGAMSSRSIAVHLGIDEKTVRRWFCEKFVELLQKEHEEAPLIAERKKRISESRENLTWIDSSF